MLYNLQSSASLTVWDARPVQGFKRLRKKSKNTTAFASAQTNMPTLVAAQHKQYINKVLRVLLWPNLFTLWGTLALPLYACQRWRQMVTVATAAEVQLPFLHAHWHSSVPLPVSPSPFVWWVMVLFILFLCAGAHADRLWCGNYSISFVFCPRVSMCFCRRLILFLFVNGLLLVKTI